MKVLLIAEDKKTVDAIVPAIQAAGADAIVYRWLIKALDNVEEIEPDAAIISTSEYPRHWKTFAQYAKSGIAGKIPRIILYNSRPMGDDEKEKARSLGVFGMFGSLDKDGIDELKNYLSGKGGEFSFLSGGTKVEFVFTNPKNGRLVTGLVKGYSGGRVEFECDVPAAANGLLAGDSIERATFGQNKIYKYVGARVLSNEKTLCLKLT